MKSISRLEFASLLVAAQVKARLRKEVRFMPEAIANWDELEFITVSDRTTVKGVFVIELEGQLYVTAYEVNKRIVDLSGRTKPIMCDLCFTWQKGSA